MASTDKVISRKDGNVGYVIFNNPERRNAMSLEMWEATTRLMSEYAKDDSIRVVVLSGAGDKAFVAGADIGELASLTPVQAQAFSRNGQRRVQLMGAPGARLHLQPCGFVQSLFDNAVIGDGATTFLVIDLDLFT